MGRSRVVVRTAGAAEAGRVAEVVSAVRAASTRDSGGAAAVPEPEAGRVAGVLARADVGVLLAEVDGDPAGVLVLRRGEVLPLSGSSAAHVDQLAVVPAHRRRGVGRALLAAAARSAEEDGLDQLVVSAPTTGREAQRFLARLGFAPLVVQRCASVAALRTQLGPQRLADGSDPAGAREAASRRLERVIVRRRRERFGAPVPGVSGGAA